jgi:predicted AlkP superfamily phosphohydrolase/phosphomutase
MRESVTHEGLPADWARSYAAVLHGEFCGYLYINSQYGNPRGSDSGPRYESLRQELANLFLKVPDPSGGGPLFSAVLKGEDLFQDASFEPIPDLVVVPRTGYLVSTKLAGRVVVEHGGGTHRKNGVLIAAGPRVASGRPMNPVHMIDLAPTILHLMGLEVPTDMDGQVIQEILTKSTPIRYSKPSSQQQEARDPFTDDERLIVEQRLRDLGYLS